MLVDQADEMLRQCRHQPLVLSLPLHPYLVGHPFRLKRLRQALRHLLDAGGDRLWLTTAGGIHDHAVGLGEAVVP